MLAHVQLLHPRLYHKETPSLTRGNITSGSIKMPPWEQHCCLSLPPQTKSMVEARWERAAQTAACLSMPPQKKSCLLSLNASSKEELLDRSLVIQFPDPLDLESSQITHGFDYDMLFCIISTPACLGKLSQQLASFSIQLFVCLFFDSCSTLSFAAFVNMDLNSLERL